MMNKALVALLVAASLVGAAGCRTDARKFGLDIQVNYREKKLPNGLEIVLVEDHTVPVVAYQTWYRVGSVDEHPGITGISHFFEHLMFKGTPKYPEKAFFSQLEAKGADVNAFTTRDYTVYHETFTPNLLGKVIDMESDRMQNLTIDDEALKTERAVVLEERGLRTDNSPAGRMQEALWKLAFRVHPYQWPVVGYPQDLFHINVGTLQSWYKAHYQPANAAVVVVGDIDADKTLSLLEDAYGKIPAQPRPKRDILAEPEQDGEHQFTMRDQVASEELGIAYHASAADNDDSYALDVLANILFEGTSSRAYRKLVEEKEVAESVEGSAYTPTYPGLFLISGVMKSGHHVSEAVDLLDQIIRKVQDEGVTTDEVKVAVKQLTVQIVDGVQTPNGLAQLIGTVYMTFGDASRFADDLAKYQKITPADVQRVARKYLNPNNRTLVKLLPAEVRK